MSADQCRLVLFHGFSDGYGEGGKAVQDGNADLELGNLTAEVPRHEAVPRQLHAVHLRLDAAPAVIRSALLPYCSRLRMAMSSVTRGDHRFRSGDHRLVLDQLDSCR